MCVSDWLTAGVLKSPELQQPMLITYQERECHAQFLCYLCEQRAVETLSKKSS